MRIKIEVSGKIKTFDVKRLVCAGYTGRNKEMVKRHILELERLGIPSPNKVPTFYELPVELLSMDDHILVSSPKTSGEVEYVLFMNRNEIFVSLGSDHTDRELEKEDVKKAKTVCPKVVAKKAWLYDEVKMHWDEIEIRSYIIENGKLKLYQEGKLSFILPPESLIEELEGEREGVVLFSGTFPVIEKLSFSDYFKMEMVDPVLGRKIGHEYRISVRLR